MGLQWNAICLYNVTNCGDNVGVTLTAFVILWLEFIPVHTEPPRSLQTPIITDLQKHPENNKSVETSYISQSTKACRPHSPVSELRRDRRMAENGFAPPPREFCRHILSCRELKAESFKRCLHSVLRGVSL